MIAVDTNILVYAHRADSSWHKSADRVMANLAESPAAWAIAWPCLCEFIAIVTHPSIYHPPTPLKDAFIQIRCWLKSPSLVLLAEGPGFVETFEAILIRARVSGANVHDARVAALCLYHGVKKLYSADRDFSRYVQLHAENPLITKT